MNLPSLIRLLLLSAIWGGSFLFMRIGAPILGPVALIESRVALAALFLGCVARALRRRLPVRAHWRHFLVLGLINTALPFLLFGTAAKTLSASLLSILNATAPIWAAVIGAVSWSVSLVLVVVTCDGVAETRASVVLVVVTTLALDAAPVPVPH